MDDVFQKTAATYEPRGRLDPHGFARHVQFGTYAPPADLAPFVEHTWAIRWAGVARPYHSDEVMHRPYVDLFFSRQGSGIQGTFRGRRTYVASGDGRIVGVRFRPGGFRPFWDGALTELQDAIGDPRRFSPRADRDFVERLLAQDDRAARASLLALVRERAPAPDPQIDLLNAIIEAIEADEGLRTVAAVARACERSERWLQQFFRDYAGIGLKWLLQRHRLLASARQIRESDRPDWVAIAYDLGYSSQAHFITAFKQVLGKTPRQYKRDLTPADAAPPDEDRAGEP